MNERDLQQPFDVLLFRYVAGGYGSIRQLAPLVRVRHLRHSDITYLHGYDLALREARTFREDKLLPLTDAAARKHGFDAGQAVWRLDRTREWIPMTGAALARVGFGPCLSLHGELGPEENEVWMKKLGRFAPGG
ncbi:hypothetical protein [Phenylobacterium sp.]|uniref:hypothetical protein n=1 Tax=Phenylobacterium sp. TaxID=1871053 RepID=UPI0035B01AFA